VLAARTWPPQQSRKKYGDWLATELIGGAGEWAITLLKHPCLERARDELKLVPPPAAAAAAAAAAPAASSHTSKRQRAEHGVGNVPSPREALRAAARELLLQRLGSGSVTASAADFAALRLLRGLGVLRPVAGASDPRFDLVSPAFLTALTELVVPPRIVPPPASPISSVNFPASLAAACEHFSHAALVHHQSQNAATFSEHIAQGELYAVLRQWWKSLLLREAMFGAARLDLLLRNGSNMLAEVCSVPPCSLLLYRTHALVCVVHHHAGGCEYSPS